MLIKEWISGSVVTIQADHTVDEAAVSIRMINNLNDHKACQDFGDTLGIKANS